MWVVILAAGAGRRLAAMTGGVPKQFWRPDTNAPSLLEGTLARMRPLAPPRRTITVVDDGHRPYTRALSRRRLQILYQPEDRGTAVGVLMPLARIHRQDPEAVVVLTPSDHGVADPLVFQASASTAIASVQARHTDIVLFGVTPTAANQDYGWITPETPDGPMIEFRRVASFVEKPPLAEAERLLRSGAVWNTMVLVARVRTLLTAFERCLPVHTAALTMTSADDGNAPSDRLRTAYRNLPAADFSQDVLSRTRPLTLFTLPATTGWSDLGTPDRLQEWLSRAPFTRRRWALPAAGRAVHLPVSHPMVQRPSIRP